MSTRFAAVLIALSAAALARADVTADFDQPHLPLSPESFYNGVEPLYPGQPSGSGDSDGRFLCGGLSLNNYHRAPSGGMGYWDGWALSNTTDTLTPGFGNQFSAIPGSGVDGSPNYGVAFVGFTYLDGHIPAIENVPGNDLLGAYFTNTTYAYRIMKEGDVNNFAKKFGGSDGNYPDWFLLEIAGTKADGSSVGTVEFYLADYRFADNAQDYIVDEWTWVDLSSLDEPATLEFDLSSSDNDEYEGMNTPAYFAMDNMVLQSVPQPATRWGGPGDGDWDAPGGWADGTPDAETNVTVEAARVTLAGEAEVSWLRINDGGCVAVDGAAAELIVGTSIEINGGTLEAAAPVEAGGVRLAAGQLRITPQGYVAAAGNIVLESASETVCEVGRSGAGRLDADARAFLGGTLTVAPIRGATGTEAEPGNFTQTLVTAAGGLEGTFDEVPGQYGSDPGNFAAAHLGHGVFNKAIRYVGDAGESSSVEIDLFVALGGDADGDGKVWLSDWAALRANFGNSGSGLRWTDGNFDPWNDEKVWLSDWAALRANFSNAGYTIAQSDATALATVPEPGTAAMLAAGGLIGLCLLIRRNDRRMRIA